MKLRPKKCAMCHKKLSPSFFHKLKTKSGRAYYWCKKCQSIYLKAYYQKNKKRCQELTRKTRIRVKRRRQLFVLIYLQSHPCIDCGETDPIVLEFDHVRGKKVDDISGMIEGAHSEELVAKEIAKCEVRCSNCHKKKTAKEYGWFDYIDFDTMTITNWDAKPRLRKRHLQIKQ